MAAINTLAVRDATLHQIVKRGNWASKNVGVVLVFAIVFVVACGLITLFFYKRMQKRKANKSQF